jgi:uncharacterized membrane protein YkoI
MYRNVAAACLILTSAISAGAQGTPTVKEEKPGLLAKAKVTAADAIVTAQAKVPKGKLASIEIEQEDGKLIYSMTFKTDGKSGVDEVNVDALTGKQVGKVEHESPAAEKKEEAKEKAAKKKP